MRQFITGHFTGILIKRIQEKFLDHTITSSKFTADSSEKKALELRAESDHYKDLLGVALLFRG